MIKVVNEVDVRKNNQHTPAKDLVTPSIKLFHELIEYLRSIPEYKVSVGGTMALFKLPNGKTAGIRRGSRYNKADAEYISPDKESIKITSVSDLIDLIS